LEYLWKLIGIFILVILFLWGISNLSQELKDHDMKKLKDRAVIAEKVKKLKNPAAYNGVIIIKKYWYEY